MSQSNGTDQNRADFWPVWIWSVSAKFPQFANLKYQSQIKHSQVSWKPSPNLPWYCKYQELPYFYLLNSLKRSKIHVYSAPFHIIQQLVLMVILIDSNNLSCGWGKLCAMATIFGQKKRWCKLRMMMTFMKFRGHHRSNGVNYVLWLPYFVKRTADAS